MMGVGPGALVSDAYMLGIDPQVQRSRMEESLDIIVRLLTEPEPITYKSDWFSLNEATTHLKPYTNPHFPIAVAAAQSPSGMVLAGKHGSAVLSVSVLRGGSVSTNLREFWKIGEETAIKHGKHLDRSQWRLVLPVHLAESRKEAIEQARAGAARYQRDYFENTMGFDSVYDGPAEEIIDAMVDQGAWCVGTPDDLVSAIQKLDEASGGFGSLLVQANEWASRENTLRSYELMARYVLPKFQGSLDSLKRSQKWAADKRGDFMDMRKHAVNKASTDFTNR